MKLVFGLYIFLLHLTALFSGPYHMTYIMWHKLEIYGKHKQMSWEVILLNNMNQETLSLHSWIYNYLRYLYKGL